MSSIVCPKCGAAWLPPVYGPVVKSVSAANNTTFYNIVPGEMAIAQYDMYRISGKGAWIRYVAHVPVLGTVKIMFYNVRNPNPTIVLHPGDRIGTAYGTHLIVDGVDYNVLPVIVEHFDADPVPVIGLSTTNTVNPAAAR